MALRADDVDLGRDRDLVARYQNGDPEAFDDLYRCYFNRLRRYCQRHTNDHHEAEEAAQEAFVKALGSIHTLQGERRFYPWMTVIARRLLIDRHRKMARIELTDEPEAGWVEPDIDHLFDEVDATHVRQALQNVGPRHREVLLLREGQALSYADVAERLGVPVTTVEALLHRARKALRREFSIVSGERRVWGLPVIGWLATRFHQLRNRVDERWVEVGAFAAPLAVGAATAAFVLAPSPSADPVEVETSRPAITVETVDEVPTTSAPPDVTTEPPPPSLPPTTSPSTAPTTTTEPAPAIDAGPVDVYLGPEGTAHAAEKAENMPLTTDLGKDVGGVDPPVVADDVVGFVTETVEMLLGGKR